MPQVYLGLGSNVEPEANLRLALRELARRFELQAVSPVYRNAAVGFEGADFLNAVVRVRTDADPPAICRELEEIHGLAGRKRGDDNFVSRPLDIDLLLYGDAVNREWRVPRDDVLDYSFVLRPLVDIAPELVHPVTGRTLSAHWHSFDQGAHALVAVPDVLSKDGA